MYTDTCIAIDTDTSIDTDTFYGKKMIGLSAICPYILYSENVYLNFRFRFHQQISTFNLFIFFKFFFSTVSNLF